MRVHRSMIHVAVAEAAMLLTASLGYANISSTSATVRPNNSLLVDVQVTSGATVEHVSITYHDHHRTAQGKPRVHLHRRRV
jgi:hypothetical protein